jgi:sugar phosphate isomerase/epimerase
VHLSLTPDSRWAIDDVDAYVDHVAAAGFRHIGLSRHVADRFSSDRVRCAELMALSVRRDEDETLRDAAALAAAAAECGGPWVLTMMNTRVRDESIELLGRCADVLAPSGARVALEFGPTGPCCSIPDAVGIVDAVGRGAGVVIDTWHFFHGPSTFEDLEGVGLDRIAYVQFDDAPGAVSDDIMHETLDRRLMPGDGILDLDRFARTLRDRGWEGMVAIEVLNSELATLPIDEFARRAWNATAPYWL